MDSGLKQSLNKLGLKEPFGGVAVGRTTKPGNGSVIVVRSPIDGSQLANVAAADAFQVEQAINAANDAFGAWRAVPPPGRGEFVRRFGETLRRHKSDLAQLVSWEAGKITQEALGEVQEMIDICDFAVGLSRQLYGKTIASERPQHRLAEQWHPLGPVGVISAFNFPVAVWAWNAAIAWVCGDSVVWKPSEKTPLCALACHRLAMMAADGDPRVPEGISAVLIGGADIGQALAQSPKLPLLSATGSVAMGKNVAQTVASRLGRSLLELGGNNGMIVSPSADHELAVRAILFAAVGSCGQRCTTLRRLIVHESIAEALLQRLKKAYTQLSIGDPTQPGTLVGPLIDQRAAQAMSAALDAARRAGGKVFGGEPVDQGVPPQGAYVRPAIVEIDANASIVQQETFAPILYVMRYRDFEEAIAIHNGVPQGLASAILTSDVREAEIFCGPTGSDCGIVNVNTSPSGAEIGGAFGGEKETGGGRESGSDAWKQYMRRTTNTVNYARDLPLAQGIRFEA